MNRTLVVCLFLSMLIGLTAAVWAVMSGWGFLVGLALYSGVGSASLVLSTLIILPGVERKPTRAQVRPAVEPAEKSAYA